MEGKESPTPAQCNRRRKGCNVTKVKAGSASESSLWTEAPPKGRKGCGGDLALQITILIQGSHQGHSEEGLGPHMALSPGRKGSCSQRGRGQRRAGTPATVGAVKTTGRSISCAPIRLTGTFLLQPSTTNSQYLPGEVLSPCMTLTRPPKDEMQLTQNRRQSLSAPSCQASASSSTRSSHSLHS